MRSWSPAFGRWLICKHYGKPAQLFVLLLTQRRSRLGRRLRGAAFGVRNSGYLLQRIYCRGLTPNWLQKDASCRRSALLMAFFYVLKPASTAARPDAPLSLFWQSKQGVLF